LKALSQTAGEKSSDDHALTELNTVSQVIDVYKEAEILINAQNPPNLDRGKVVLLPLPSTPALIANAIGQSPSMVALVQDPQRSHSDNMDNLAQSVSTETNRDSCEGLNAADSEAIYKEALVLRRLKI
jgi:F0F1-type ATP synthase delta subunit